MEKKGIIPLAHLTKAAREGEIMLLESLEDPQLEQWRIDIGDMRAVVSRPVPQYPQLWVWRDGGKPRVVVFFTERHLLELVRAEKVEIQSKIGLPKVGPLAITSLILVAGSCEISYDLIKVVREITVNLDLLDYKVEGDRRDFISRRN